LDFNPVYLLSAMPVTLCPNCGQRHPLYEIRLFTMFVVT
jgi:hypothetical protein